MTSASAWFEEVLKQEAVEKEKRSFAENGLLSVLETAKQKTENISRPVVPKKLGLWGKVKEKVVRAGFFRPENEEEYDRRLEVAKGFLPEEMIKYYEKFPIDTYNLTGYGFEYHVKNAGRPKEENFQVKNIEKWFEWVENNFDDVEEPYRNAADCWPAIVKAQEQARKDAAHAEFIKMNEEIEERKRNPPPEPEPESSEEYEAWAEAFPDEESSALTPLIDPEKFCLVPWPINYFRSKEDVRKERWQKVMEVKKEKERQEQMFKKKEQERMMQERNKDKMERTKVLGRSTTMSLGGTPRKGSLHRNKTTAILQRSDSTKSLQQMGDDSDSDSGRGYGSDTNPENNGESSSVARSFSVPAQRTDSPMENTPNRVKGSRLSNVALAKDDEIEGNSRDDKMKEELKDASSGSSGLDSIPAASSDIPDPSTPLNDPSGLESIHAASSDIPDPSTPLNDHPSSPSSSSKVDLSPPAMSHPLEQFLGDVPSPSSPSNNDPVAAIWGRIDSASERRRNLLMEKQNRTRSGRRSVESPEGRHNQGGSVDEEVSHDTPEGGDPSSVGKDGEVIPPLSSLVDPRLVEASQRRDQHLAEKRLKVRSGRRGPRTGGEESFSPAGEQQEDEDTSPIVRLSSAARSRMEYTESEVGSPLSRGGGPLLRPLQGVYRGETPPEQAGRSHSVPRLSSESGREPTVSVNKMIMLRKHQQQSTIAGSSMGSTPRSNGFDMEMGTFNGSPQTPSTPTAIGSSASQAPTSAYFQQCQRNWEEYRSNRVREIAVRPSTSVETVRKSLPDNYILRRGKPQVASLYDSAAESSPTFTNSAFHPSFADQQAGSSFFKKKSSRYLMKSYNRKLQEASNAVARSLSGPIQSLITRDDVETAGELPSSEDRTARHEGWTKHREGEVWPVYDGPVHQDNHQDLKIRTSRMIHNDIVSASCSDLQELMRHSSPQSPSFLQNLALRSQRNVERPRFGNPSASPLRASAEHTRSWLYSMDGSLQTEEREFSPKVGSSPPKVFRATNLNRRTISRDYPQDEDGSLRSLAAGVSAGSPARMRNRSTMGNKSRSSNSLIAQSSTAE